MANNFSGSQPVTSYIVENDLAFQKAFEKLSKEADDLRIPLGLIRNEFYRSNRKIFKLQSQGLYPDFGGFNPSKKIKYKGVLMSRREAYKLMKKAEVGFVYPMLTRKGPLETSLTNPRGKGAFSRLTKRDLILGSTIPHLKYHQSDKLPRKKIPQRKLLFIDGGPLEPSRGANVSGRIETWLNIIETHIAENIRKVKF